MKNTNKKLSVKLTKPSYDITNPELEMQKDLKIALAFLNIDMVPDSISELKTAYRTSLRNSHEDHNGSRNGFSSAYTRTIIMAKTVLERVFNSDPKTIIQIRNNTRITKSVLKYYKDAMTYMGMQYGIISGNKKKRMAKPKFVISTPQTEFLLPEPIICNTLDNSNNYTEKSIPLNFIDFNAQNINVLDLKQKGYITHNRLSQFKFDNIAITDYYIIKRDRMIYRQLETSDKLIWEKYTNNGHYGTVVTRGTNKKTYIISELAHCNFSGTLRVIEYFDNFYIKHAFNFKDGELITPKTLHSPMLIIFRFIHSKFTDKIHSNSRVVAI